jgi:hypothetical protein
VASAEAVRPAGPPAGRQFVHPRDQVA